MTCLVLLSLGCSGDKPKETIQRKEYGDDYDKGVSDMRFNEEIQGVRKNSSGSPTRNQQRKHKR
jgi:hypothetical protein